MKYTLTERALLLLADWFDFNSQWSWKTFTAMPDDPRLHQHRYWIKKYLENRKKKEKLRRAFESLKRREILQKKIFRNSEGYLLTTRGRLRILRLKRRGTKRENLPESQWLMVIFDIPEKLRKTRDVFRRILYDLGFEQLQKSVWITTYDVLKDLEEVIINCHLQRYVKFLFVKKLLSQSNILKISSYKN